MFKKALILFVCVLGFINGFSQTNEWYYKAISTELYIKNDYTDKWELHQKNGNTNITIVMEDEFISIQAQKPTIYRIYRENTTDISNDKITGMRYVAKDLKSEQYCTLDVIKSRTSEYYLLSIVNGKINLRYFINQN